MHTVVETAAYLSSARRIGMTEAEMRTTVDALAADPQAGDRIVGSGGCRKVRVAGRGKGKSGGYRVVTFYANVRTPVFLLAVLSKGSDANFSAAQVKALAKAAKEIIGNSDQGGSDVRK